MKKKTVCFIGQNERTCTFIARQLRQFLKEYIDVKTWCLQYSSTPSDFLTSDIYLTSSNTTLEQVMKHLPANKIVMVAARTINIETLDALLEIEPGSKALLVGSSPETANLSIKIIASLGINYLDLIPYYPGCQDKIPSGINLAITTGQSHLVPRTIPRVVDLGVKGIDLSTFVELINHLKGVPLEVINEISQYYIEAILNLTLRQQNIARLNEGLKRRMEVILNTVDEAIVAVNEINEIVVANPAAEKLLDINSIKLVGKDAKGAVPQVDFMACLETGEGIIHDIRRINGNYYVVTTNPIIEDSGRISGAVATLRPVGEVQELETKVRRELKKKGNVAKHAFSDIIGESEELHKAIALAKKFSQTELTVLLEGESGTGKEVFAQAIHNLSHRKNGPFVAINFAALPENLVESELFGYEEGAFTGAKKGGKPGLFEEAHLGTIFLDEIGDASLEVQKKLLRVLEEREVRRVGGSTVTPVDVRIIAATNQDLANLVQEGKFRNDLFYRLCTLPISIPPLRERGSDIFLLMDYFAKTAFGYHLQIEEPLIDYLTYYKWPGNIRELQNIVKYICSVVQPNEPVTIKHLPVYLARVNIAGSPSANTFKPFNDEKYELAIKELRKQDAFEPIVAILSEIQMSSILNKGLGRQSLVKRLEAKSQDFPDHKIRHWLKMLDEMGYVDSGVTRQGSKITKQGEEFLEYLRRSRTS